MSPFEEPFTPPIGLSNPHLQTILSSLGRKNILPRREARFIAAAEERIIEIEGLQQMVHVNTQPESEQAPLVMLIPGWLGHVNSTYVLSAGKALWQAGFNVVRINLRDHGETAHLNEGLFHSALLDEVVALIDHILDDFNATKAGLMGYSLGGNFALRIAERRRHLATLAVCPALSPSATIHRIESNRIYSEYFLRKWRRLYKQKERAFPGKYDFDQAMRLSSMQALTDYFVKYHTEYASTDEYFAAYDITGDYLNGVDAHILAAMDDPIIRMEDLDALPTAINQHRIAHGGHGAFLDSWQLTSWGDRFASHFFCSKLLKNNAKETTFGVS